MTVSFRRWHGALVAAMVALATTAFTFPGGQHAGSRVTSVVSLAQTQLPESIAIGYDGDMYVSLFTSGEILKVTPSGATSPFATVPGAPTGVRFDRFGNLYVAVVNLTDSASSGVYRIPAGGGDPVEVATVPGFPNGLAFDRAGNLYVSESFGGKVYRIDRSGAVTVWSDSPLLLGTGDTGPCGDAQKFPGAGANGLAFDAGGDTLYVANTTVGTVVRIPVRRGGAAGPASVFAGPACSLWGADGLAMDVAGNLYVAANAEQDIVRVDPRGNLRVLAAASAGDLLSNPSDIAFGTTWWSRSQIFITNFAYFNGGQNSGVVKMDVGIPGLRLP